MNKTDCYISLGSNMGEREQNLAKTLQALAALPGITLGAVSPLYQTEPQLVRDQAWFLNMVACLHCAPEIQPLELLVHFQTIEQRLGKAQPGDAGYTRFGPRPIDIDMLLFGNLVCSCPQLELPHPRMLERAFVLVPLCDIAPKLVLPQGQRVHEALSNIGYRLEGQCIYQV